VPPEEIVIEDVDLIAQEQAHMRDPSDEVLLNKLLNEMDGLEEDSEVLFILATNRSDQIEPALHRSWAESTRKLNSRYQMKKDAAS
jgi:cell division protease FtsH